MIDVLPTRGCPNTGQRFVRHYKMALDRGLCDAVIDGFNSSTAVAPGRVGASGEHYRPDLKKCSELRVDSRELPSASFALVQAWQTTLKRYVEDVPIFARMAGEQTFEHTGFRIQKYAQDAGSFGWHADTWDLASSRRVLAMILYLNDVFVGGETEFHDGLTVRPEAGSVLWFPPGFEYTHRGVVPRSCAKYIATTFLVFK